MPGSLAQTASNENAPAPTEAIPYPVRYADGVAMIAQTDLRSDGFGFPWGQTRTWSNGTGYATGSANGNGWTDTHIPHLLQADGSTNNTLILITNGETALYYDLDGGLYQPRLNDHSQLTYDSTNDAFTLIDTTGGQTVLNGFGTTRPAAQRGEFASYTAANGVTMAVTSYTTDGHVAG